MISSVSIIKDGNMIWNHTEKAQLTMKNFGISQMKDYLSKISDNALYPCNVYQIEEKEKIFSKIVGDRDTIMGLPIKQIKNFLEKFA